MASQNSSGGRHSPRKMKKLDDSQPPVSDSEDEDSEETGFDPATQKTLEEIEYLQKELYCLNSKAAQEIHDVRLKYNKLKKPHFDNRNEIISRVKNFWSKSLVYHPEISLLIDEEVGDCLQFLTKMEVEEFEDIKSGYRIKFTFCKENPFFTNGLLVKEFHLGEEPKSTSTDVQWKQGMDLTKDSNQRRKRGFEPWRWNFFSWLADNGDPSSDHIAEVIKNDLWPNPLPYFVEAEVDAQGIVTDEEDTDEDSEDDEDDEAVVVEEEEEVDDEEPELAAAG